MGDPGLLIEWAQADNHYMSHDFSGLPPAPEPSRFTRIANTKPALAAITLLWLLLGTSWLVLATAELEQRRSFGFAGCNLALGLVAFWSGRRQLHKYRSASPAG